MSSGGTELERLLASTDDPRVAAFMKALDRINGLGKRMPGFQWMMEGAGAPGVRLPNLGNAEEKIGGDAQVVSNLTLWATVATLEAFVWNRVHRQSVNGVRNGSRCWGGCSL